MNKAITPRAAHILEFLSKYEAKNNYLAYIAHGSNTKPFANTLGDVLKFMSKLKAEGMESTAIGAYQIIQPTLLTLMSSLRLTNAEPWTNDLQDLLGMALLRKRGFDHWAGGLMSDNSFCNQLALEWASMPYYNSGASYYGGVGSNKALVSRAAFVAAITAAGKLSNVIEPAKPAASVVAHNEEKIIMTTAVPAATVVGVPSSPKDFVTTALNGIAAKLNTVASGIEGELSSVFNGVKLPALDGVSFNEAATAAVGSAGSAVDCAKELVKLALDIKGLNLENAAGDLLHVMSDAIAIMKKFNVNTDMLTEVHDFMAKYVPAAA